MSNPDNQRADGCSVFFTFLVLALLLSGFYFAQKIFEPEAPAPVTEAIDKARTAKAVEFRNQNDEFISSVDSFHRDRNSSIETSMRNVLKKYKSSSKQKPIQKN